MRHIVIATLLATLIAPHGEAGQRLLRFRLRPLPVCPSVVVPGVDAHSFSPAIPNHNPVNLDAGPLPTSWSVERGKQRNIKWVAEIGDMPFGSPVVAHGVVYVAANEWRDPNSKQRKAAMLAFRETDGKLLWQNLHGYPAERIDYFRAMPSRPTVDGSRMYYLTPSCELICAVRETGNIVWRFDAVKELRVFPGVAATMYQLPSGAPLVVGNLVYIIVGNGSDEENKLVSAGAPSFVALDKRTGKVRWTSNLPGNRIVEGQWSSPAFAHVNGVPQIIMPGGDAVIYGFEPVTGKLLWKCDCGPLAKATDKHMIDKYFLAAPVVVGNRLYIGLGVPPEHVQSPRWSWFLCLDVTRCGDVSIRSSDPTAPANRDSALVWAVGGPIQPAPAKGRRVVLNNIISAAAVHDGLVYVCEEYGYLHCLDAATGKRYWEHDFKDSVLGSPYWADGKVYVASDDGNVVIFAHGRTKKVIAQNDMDNTIVSTPTATNGVLYVMARSKLYAIATR